MIKSAPSMTRIYQLVFGLAFLFVCYSAVRRMMFGSTRNVKMIAALALAFGAVMALDRRYWVAVPFSIVAASLRIPGVKFSMQETGCLVLVGMHVARLCMRRDVNLAWSGRLLWAVPFISWIAMVFLMNPTGMKMFGSASIGGRFYLDVFLGFAAMVCMSVIRLSEEDFKTLYRTLLFAAILVVAIAVTRPSFFDAGDDFQYSSHYQLLVFTGLYSVLLARYSLDEILSSLWKLAVLGICALAILVSGKRAAGASIGILPVLRAFLAGRNRAFVSVAMLICLFLMSFVVAMDGQFFDLPRSARRPLSMVFPKYRNMGYAGTEDAFRRELRAIAKRYIREHPFVGRKGFRMDMEELVLLQGTSNRAGEHAGHEQSGSWHSQIYACAADFGIPCLVFYILLLGSTASLAFRTCRAAPPGTYRSACCLFAGMQVWWYVIISYTSGGGTLYQTILMNLAMMMMVANPPPEGVSPPMKQEVPADSTPQPLPL
jgi:hypothetical protein